MRSLRKLSTVLLVDNTKLRTPEERERESITSTRSRIRSARSRSCVVLKVSEGHREVENASCVIPQNCGAEATHEKKISNTFPTSSTQFVLHAMTPVLVALCVSSSRDWKIALSRWLLMNKSVRRFCALCLERHMYVSEVGTVLPWCLLRAARSVPRLPQIPLSEINAILAPITTPGRYILRRLGAFANRWIHPDSFWVIVPPALRLSLQRGSGTCACGTSAAARGQRSPRMFTHCRRIKLFRRRLLCKSDRRQPSSSKMNMGYDTPDAKQKHGWAHEEVRVM